MSLRPCPECRRTLAPSAFRDPSEAHMTGRPPKVCASCRAMTPALQAHHAKNVARREPARQRQRKNAQRTSLEIDMATVTTHPSGYKTCPEGSGCGRLLPTAFFYTDRFQADGLRATCDDCPTASR